MDDESETMYGNTTQCQTGKINGNVGQTHGQFDIGQDGNEGYQSRAHTPAGQAAPLFITTSLPRVSHVLKHK